MKNHRFPWLRNRTTDNRKCEKARNIKEKRTIEMFSTVSKQLVELLSSQNDNYKETTKKIQTQEMLIFPGFSLCPLICGTPQKSINFLR
jgi:hypothetical protein